MWNAKKRDLLESLDLAQPRIQYEEDDQMTAKESDTDRLLSPNGSDHQRRQSTLSVVSEGQSAPVSPSRQTSSRSIL